MIISGRTGMIKKATKMPEKACPQIMKSRLSGMLKNYDGPFRNVAHPSRIAERIRVNRLETHLGKHCTMSIDGMYVRGIIVNMYPTCIVVRPNSASLGAKIDSS